MGHGVATQSSRPPAHEGHVLAKVAQRHPLGIILAHIRSCALADADTSDAIAAP